MYLIINCDRCDNKSGNNCPINLILVIDLDEIL